MEKINFKVRGSTNNEYDVIFEVHEGKAKAFCNCQAGINGSACKHRFSIMDGDISSLISGNPEDVVRLKSIMEGTNLLLAYSDMVNAEAVYEKAKKVFNNKKKEVTSIMYKQL